MGDLQELVSLRTKIISGAKYLLPINDDKIPIPAAFKGSKFALLFDNESDLTTLINAKFSYKEIVEIREYLIKQRLLVGISDKIVLDQIPDEELKKIIDQDESVQKLFLHHKMVAIPLTQTHTDTRENKNKHLEQYKEIAILDFDILKDRDLLGKIPAAIKFTPVLLKMNDLVTAIIGIRASITDKAMQNKIDNFLNNYRLALAVAYNKNSYDTLNKSLCNQVASNNKIFSDIQTALDSKKSIWDKFNFKNKSSSKLEKLENIVVEANKFLSNAVPQSNAQDTSHKINNIGDVKQHILKL